MRILFTASQRGKETYRKQYEAIYQEIKNLGYRHLDDDILQVQTGEFYKKIQEGDREAQIEFYKNKIDQIQKADINIFDASVHSLSIGFVIQKSLEFNKPTVVLYFEENIPYFLTGSDDDKLILKSYTMDNYKAVLKDVLENAELLRDKRFNFFISPQLLNYLNKASKREGVTKSVFLRNLILEHKRKVGNTIKDRE